MQNDVLRTPTNSRFGGVYINKYKRHGYLVMHNVISDIFKDYATRFKNDFEIQ